MFFLHLFFYLLAFLSGYLPSLSPLLWMSLPWCLPPAPAGLLFVTNIDSSDPDQLVYKTLDPADRLPGPAGDLALNSYLGL